MAYDSAIITYTTKTDKVDIVAAAHINAVQAELVTIETILGTNVKGDRADLKTRLNNALDADGSIFSGTSFPSPALPSQGFYRTDLDTFYIRNAANATWNALGASLSNVVFSWASKAQTATESFFYISSSLDPNAASVAKSNYSYIACGSTVDTYREVLKTKFTKISGINTLTTRFYCWGSGSGANRDITIKTTCNALTATGTVNAPYTAPAWGSSTLDVSSLSNGTTYDMTFDLKFGTSEVYGALGSLIVIAS